MYERIIFNQLAGYFDSILHPQLCGFRSKHNTQHALLRMIGHWHKCLDRSGKVGSILMDLSKAFDCIDHELLIAKLAAYGLDSRSLKLFKCYLNNRFQRTRVGSFFSSWLLILKGVPQGSILGPLLFNIFINDLLTVVTKTDICNFADDNTIYSCANSLTEVILKLKDDLPIVLSWFKANQLAANPSKFQMLVLGVNDSKLPISIQTANTTITSTDTVELFGISIDSKLTFSSHISSLCHRASQKIRNLNRISPYLQQNQLKLLFNSFILSTFNYAPIIWMFCSKSSCKKVDSIHKRALRTVYQDFTKSYEELLQISGYKRIHEVHIVSLLCEVYKTVNGLNPPFMQSLFTVKPVRYQLRNCNLLAIPPARSSRNGNQSFQFRGSLLWNTLPDCVKSKPSLNSFKICLKALDLLGLCNCKLCNGI